MRAICQIAASLLLLAIVSCTLKMPGAPVWTIDATIPFSQRIYRMGEMITDSETMANRNWGIKINPGDSVLLFESYDSLDHQSVDNRITYEPSDVGSYTNNIGLINIERPNPERDSVSVSEANPDFRNGYRGTLPPFTLQEMHDTLQFNVFHWMHVNQGKLELTITNKFPFPLDSLSIGFANLADNNFIGAISFNRPIAVGASLSDSLDLSGLMISNKLKMTVKGHSPGSATVIRIRGNEQIKFLTGITESEVDSADAEIGEQRFEKPDELEINNRNRVIEADVKSGHAYFWLTNTTPFRLQSEMVFENMFDSSGAKLSRAVSLDPYEQSELRELDLTGTRLLMTLADQGIHVSNSATSEDTRTTLYQGNTYQVISSEKGIEVQYWTDDLIFSKFEGILDSININIPDMTTIPNFPQGLDSVNFMSDTIFVSINNESVMRLQSHLQIAGTNSRTGRSVSVPMNEDMLPGETVLRVPGSDRLMSIFPDTIIISGWAGIGKKFFPDQGAAVISQYDGLSGSFLARSALKFTNGRSRIVTEPHSLRDSLNYPVQSIDVDVYLKNSIPMSGTVKLLMGNDTLAMDTLITVDIPRNSLVHYRVVAAAETSATVGLDSTQIAIMHRLPLFTQQVMSFNSSQGDTAWIYPDDSLVVQAAAHITYKVNPNHRGN